MNCARRKSSNRKPSAAMANFSFVGYPMGRVAIDIMGPLPMSTQENIFIIVAVDYFTFIILTFRKVNAAARTEFPRKVNKIYSDQNHPLYTLLKCLCLNRTEILEITPFENIQNTSLQKLPCCFIHCIRALRMYV